MAYVPAILFAKLNSVCPIMTLGMGDPKDTSTITFTPDVTATKDQIAAAQSILAALTPTILNQAEAIVQTAAAAIPDPLAAAKVQAISSLPTAQVQAQQPVTPP